MFRKERCRDDHQRNRAEVVFDLND